MSQNENGLYFALEARNRAFKYFSFAHFTKKQGHHELVYSPQHLKLSPKFLEIDRRKITLRVRLYRLLFQSLNKVALEKLKIYMDMSILIYSM